MQRSELDRKKKVGGDNDRLSLRKLIGRNVCMLTKAHSKAAMKRAHLHENQAGKTR